ncbi:hypothetical protein DID77_04295 [Candidatus Marinamargulisbacteria bacterium SCGC AG-439-L15]|nr:hypothetical protein DID77_04295 [Candidatus Marinamargulisbacteria bacterium SCGC AG-439-L15]
MRYTLDMDEPISHYKDQILNAFECQQTGNCCRADGYVYANAKEIERMATHLEIDVSTFMARYVKTENGWTLISDLSHRPTCFLREDGGCGIYEVRPKQCRTYPNWPELWTSKEALMKETLLCKGLRRAVEMTLGQSGVESLDQNGDDGQKENNPGTNI